VSGLDHVGTEHHIVVSTHAAVVSCTTTVAVASPEISRSARLERRQLERFELDNGGIMDIVEGRNDGIFDNLLIGASNLGSFGSSNVIERL
jgi:hypothetical protein